MEFPTQTIDAASFPSPFFSLPSRRCAYPNQLTGFYLGYIISLFALFMNFYLKRWNNKPTSAGKAKRA